MAKELKAYKIIKEMKALQKQLHDHQEKCEHKRGVFS